MRFRTQFILILAMIIGIGTMDLAAKGSKSSSRSSSKSSSSKSSGWSSSKKTTTPSKGWSSKKATKPSKSTVAKKAAPKSKGWANTKKPAKKAVVSKSAKKKAKADLKKQTPAQKKKNKAANKKYGDRKKASKTAKADLAKKNKYNSKTPPSKRPDHIPQNVTINNTNINTSYGMLPGGGYGYGYMDPMTMAFCAMGAQHMRVNDAYMMNNGYGTWGAYNGRPPYYNPHYGGILILFALFGMIALAMVFIPKMKD